MITWTMNWTRQSSKWSDLKYYLTLVWRKWGMSWETSVMIVGILVKIWTVDLRNIIQECCHLDDFSPHSPNINDTYPSYKSFIHWCKSPFYWPWHSEHKALDHSPRIHIPVIQVHFQWPIAQHSVKEHYHPVSTYCVQQTHLGEVWWRSLCTGTTIH